MLCPYGVKSLNLELTTYNSKDSRVPVYGRVLVTKASCQYLYFCQIDGCGDRFLAVKKGNRFAKMGVFAVIWMKDEGVFREKSDRRSHL
jgi:hypothetical protein